MRNTQSRVLVVLVVLSLPVVTVAVASAPAAAAPASGMTATSTPDPVVYVHGFATGTGPWFPWRAQFVADGVPRARLFSLQYDSNSGNTSSNRVIAQELGEFIRDTVLPATGASQVDIIAHSMGSLSARWCVRFGRCAGVVDSLVAIAGPNHGTIWAAACPVSYPNDRACREMSPGSDLLTRLNQGDETPGPVRYTTVRSTADLVAVPSVTAELRGADNRVVPGLGHIATITDAGIYPIVRTALGA